LFILSPPLSRKPTPDIGARIDRDGRIARLEQASTGSNGAVRAVWRQFYPTVRMDAPDARLDVRGPLNCLILCFQTFIACDPRQIALFDAHR
jgi:hypothetical protein